MMMMKKVMVIDSTVDRQVAANGLAVRGVTVLISLGWLGPLAGS